PRERHHRAIDGRGAPGRRGLVAQRETEVSAPASARGLSRSPLRGSPRRPTSTSEVVGPEDDDGVGVASGSGVLQERAREEVRVAPAGAQMTAQRPGEDEGQLAADEATLTAVGGLDEVEAVVVEAVGGAVAPEDRPARLEDEGLQERQLHEGVHVEEVHGADDRRLAEVVAPGEERIERAEGAVAGILVAAG